MAHPFVNAGFAAGTARVFLDYFRVANRLLDTALVGVGPWGDQVAMNRYIHENVRASGRRSPTPGTTASPAATRTLTGSAATAAPSAATAIRYMSSTATGGRSGTALPYVG